MTRMTPELKKSERKRITGTDLRIPLQQPLGNLPYRCQDSIAEWCLGWRSGGLALCCVVLNGRGQLPIHCFRHIRDQQHIASIIYCVLIHTRCTHNVTRSVHRSGERKTPMAESVGVGCMLQAR